MQAVPLAGSIFISPLGSYQLEFQGQLKTNKCIRILEKSDSKECQTNLECRKSKMRSKPF